jgi:hypothetical protein
MKNFTLLIILFMFFNCEWQHKNMGHVTNEISVVSVELFPAAARRPGIIIVAHFSSNEIFLKPTGQATLELPSPPPAPDSIEQDLSNPELPEVELLNMNKEEKEVLISKIQLLQGADLESKYNFDVKDGLGIRIDILYRDLNTKKIILVNDATDHQREFLKVLFGVIKTNTIKNKGRFNSLFPI